MTFQRVSRLKSWVIGSLESETGSEFLFGFDPEQGLMWLERPGHEYSSADAVWGEAESYIRTSGMLGNGPVDVPVEFDEEDYTVQVPVNAGNVERPKTVTRSASSEEYAVPQMGDPRIVGDLEPGNIEASDEDIAAQAAAFLQNLGEEE